MNLRQWLTRSVLLFCFCTAPLCSSHGETGYYGGLVFAPDGRAGFLKLRSPFAGSLFFGDHAYHPFLTFQTGSTESNGVPSVAYEIDFTAGGFYDADFLVSLTANLTFQQGVPEVFGTVDNGTSWRAATWSAEATGYVSPYSAVTNPFPHPGAYTLVFAPSEGESEPAGIGFATAEIDPGGDVRLTGSLPDGSALKQRTFLLRDRRWPFYCILYGRNGWLAGWLQLDGATADLQPVRWTKLRQHPTDGGRIIFQHTLTPILASYRPPKPRTSPLDFTEGIAVFVGGGLTGPVTNTFRITGNGKATNTSSNRFTLSFRADTGSFSGSFKVPATKTSHRFLGAVLQNQNCGFGYFRTTDPRGGFVYIGPQP